MISCAQTPDISSAHDNTWVPIFAYTYTCTIRYVKIKSKLVLYSMGDVLKIATL
jgi:hypothetical protein